MPLMCDEMAEPTVAAISRSTAPAHAIDMGDGWVQIQLGDIADMTQIVMPKEVAARLVIALTPAVNNEINNEIKELLRHNVEAR